MPGLVSPFRGKFLPETMNGSFLTVPRSLFPVPFSVTSSLEGEGLHLHPRSSYENFKVQTFRSHRGLLIHHERVAPYFFLYGWVFLGCYLLD